VTSGAVRVNMISEPKPYTDGEDPARYLFELDSWRDAALAALGSCLQSDPEHVVEAWCTANAQIDERYAELEASVPELNLEECTRLAHLFFESWHENHRRDPNGCDAPIDLDAPERIYCGGRAKASDWGACVDYYGGDVYTGARNTPGLFVGVTARKTPTRAAALLLATRTQPKGWCVEFEASPPLWAILEDRKTIVSPTWSKAEYAERARAWRDSIPDLRGREIVAFMAPGRALAAVVWFPEPRKDAVVDAWCCGMSGLRPNDEAEPRFAQVSYPFPSGTDIYLEADAPVAALPSRAEVLGSVSTPGRRYLTGIAELDRQMRAGGVPIDARIVLVGQKGSLKTTLALVLAEAWLAAGGCVLWVAADESAASITARQLQHRGLSATRAAELRPEDVATIPDRFAVVPPDYLEDLWTMGHAAAATEGAPLMVVSDSVQKLLSRAGEGKGERERIEASLEAVEALQARMPALWVSTSEATAGGEAKGARGIGYTATLELHLARSGDAVRVAIDKNRHGDENGFALRIDRNAQRIVTAAQAAASEADAGLQTQIVEALKEHGPMARTRIETWITGDSGRIRAALNSMVEAGTLTYSNKRYSLSSSDGAVSRAG
jgi:hypothetical protein